MATLTIPATTRPVTGRGPAPVRLTARGRRVVRAAVLLPLVLLTLVVLALTIGAAARAGDEPAPALRQVVVQPGDTLWTVATSALPGVDGREAVAQVRELNDLDPAATIHPGQALRLPPATS